MQRIIEQTADGSATLFVPELNEHYHSVKGAHTESQHIFIDMGLNATAAVFPHVLEVGFGTGLNALLTLENAGKTQKRCTTRALSFIPLPGRRWTPCTTATIRCFGSCMPPPGKRMSKSLPGSPSGKRKST